ncbi:hypothetical protein Scep_019985 [Stephania cephalantha]|uniref:Uncharacterized protein n=1 Tax=Stephania cephalantha TaxID=152367 RepID=A0AAP0NQE0_9MAGN
MKVSDIACYYVSLFCFDSNPLCISMQLHFLDSITESLLKMKVVLVVRVI